MHLQVASHAQKYFIRLSSQNKKDKRRSSIHDITSVHPPGVLPCRTLPYKGSPAYAGQAAADCHGSHHAFSGRECCTSLLQGSTQG